MILATGETIRNACEWMLKTLVAEGDTNLMFPLKQAVEMVGKNSGLIPLIFLIADGTVEDERDICNMMKFGHVDGGLSSPRIFAFGIGGLSSLKNKIPTTLQSLLLEEVRKCSKLGNEKVICLRNPCVGFGNLKATCHGMTLLD
uniref:Uncharacterized protein n=1 Tax=Lactuca sativa TaxID=4236 RepID=A0A9R1XDM3_LACSA|nr:hypothetical protein LSAT_V11C400184260 [Lactuca sativa]